MNLSALESTRLCNETNDVYLTNTNTVGLFSVLSGILAIQDDVNTKMGGGDWAESENEYITALHVETGEAIESIGYEWWKQATPNRSNTLTELCDIFTFLISHAMQQGEAGELYLTLSTYFEGDLTYTSEMLDGYRDHVAREKLRSLTSSVEFTGSGEGFEVLLDALYTLNFTLEDLVLTYLAKADLNRFRTEHGYKEGKYIKTWDDGREDNYHMMDYLLGEAADVPTEEKIGYVKNKMNEYYLTHVKK